jgi:guanine deaminase
VLISGQLLLETAPGRVGLARGQVLIREARIARVSTAEAIGTPDLGSDEHLISPGFIDAHVHLPQMDCIGVDGLTLLDWLHTAVFPTEAAWADTDHAAERSRVAARRLLRAGTTGAAAYATVHHAGAQAAIRAMAEAGLRGVVGQVLMDQQAPAELCRPAEQLLREAGGLRGAGRIEPAVTPRFAVSCSDALLRGAGELARATGWAVQTHLSETLPECDLVARLHPGSANYTHVYTRAGLLGPRAILGHGIHLSADEQREIRRAGAVVAHCPTANLFLQAGAMDRAGRLHAGVKVGLGSDVAGGPDPCMVRVARAMIETAKSRRLLGAGDHPPPTPAEAWHQITAGNADALGWADAGRLREAHAADLVLIRAPAGENLGAAQARWWNAPDPLSAVLYGFDERWIERVIVAGRIAE